MADDVRSKDEAPQASVMTDLPTRLAPLAIFVAAWLYFCGASYYSYLLWRYGLPAGIVQLSLQQTMVAGYSAFIDAIWLPVVASFVIVLVLFQYHGFWRGQPKVNYDVFDKRRPIVRFTAVVYFLFFGLGSGLLIAIVAARDEYSRYAIRVDRACTECFLYNTSRGRVVGLPLVQDERSFVLVTRSGAVLLPTGSVKAVRAINPSKASSRWRLMMRN